MGKKNPTPTTRRDINLNNISSINRNKPGNRFYPSMMSQQMIPPNEYQTPIFANSAPTL